MPDAPSPGDERVRRPPPPSGRWDAPADDDLISPAREDESSKAPALPPPRPQRPPINRPMRRGEPDGSPRIPPGARRQPPPPASAPPPATRRPVGEPDRALPRPAPRPRPVT